MHKGMQCYITPLLQFELTQALLFVCSFVLFSPNPLIVFLVAMKKCAMPLSEPLFDHRPRSESGAEGVSSHMAPLTRMKKKENLIKRIGKNRGMQESRSERTKTKIFLNASSEKRKEERKKKMKEAKRKKMMEKKEIFKGRSTHLPTHSTQICDDTPYIFLNIIDLGPITSTILMRC